MKTLVIIAVLFIIGKRERVVENILQGNKLTAFLQVLNLSVVDLPIV